MGINMQTDSYVVIVVGGGPGGYVAAIRAAQLGFRTAIVEREALGGICLNWGCIPTKALLRSADIYDYIQHAKSFGIEVSSSSFQIKDIIDRSRKIAKQLSDGIGMLMKKNKIDVIYGYARLAGNGIIDIIQQDNKQNAEENKSKNSSKIPSSSSNIRISSPHIILATGARARSLPNLTIDHKVIWDYRDAMTPPEMPQSLLVIGSGAIGVEFASFYATFGCKVTLIEIADRILLSEDDEIATFARKMFEQRGIEIITSADILNIKVSDDSAKVTLQTSKDQSINKTFDRILSAVGVLPNTDDLGLEKTKVTLGKGGYVEIDEFMRTNEPGVYAIGDITTFPLLAHKASHQGIVCIEKIANLPNVHGIKKENIPGCTYSSPQIASVGLTEKAAISAGYKIRIGKFPFVGNGKAIAMGEPQGLIKLIFEEKTGELLGAHLVGTEVTELISTLVLAKTAECTENEIIATVFPHPTLSEMLHEAALAAQNRAIHI